MSLKNIIAGSLIALLTLTNSCSKDRSKKQDFQMIQVDENYDFSKKNKSSLESKLKESEKSLTLIPKKKVEYYLKVNNLYNCLANNESDAKKRCKKIETLNQSVMGQSIYCSFNINYRSSESINLNGSCYIKDPRGRIGNRKCNFKFSLSKSDEIKSVKIAKYCNIGYSNEIENRSLSKIGISGNYKYKLSLRNLNNNNRYHKTRKIKVNCKTEESCSRRSCNKYRTCSY